nr:10298_t:CDS:2 [Entrophospora candida]
MGTNQPSSPLSHKSESTTSSIQLRTLTSIPTGYNARIEEEHHSSEGKPFSTWPKLNYNIDINNIDDNGNNDSDKYSFDSSSSSQDQKIKSSSNQLKRSSTIGTLINMKKNTLSHKKSLSHHINSSLSRRSDTIHQAAQRFSTMILGTNMDEENRLIVIDPDSKNPLIDPRTKKPFITNFITTSRYNICTFLPKQLYAQFSKFANFYFLFVAILQTIPNYSPTGQFTTIIPLAVFIIIAMAHEGFDDYRRHKHDNVENNKEESKWKNLKVGDFVSVKAQEWIPADILLLHSKSENGICYVETSALDGETNLKQRQALKATNSLLSSPEPLANFKAKVKTENPNQDLYNFDGSIELPDGSIHPLTNNQILLRGTILRNTPEIYGVIIFTGEETKLRMNASKNIPCTISSVLWDNGIGGNLWYMGETPKQIQVILFGFIILYNTMIPISLYVTMEVTKLVQAYLINNDLAMYHEESDTPAEARTSTINEDLGQVSYLFSDKTGTLTDNIMLFRKLSVGGRSFLHDLDIRKIEEEEILKMAMKKKFSIRNQKSKKRISLASITRHFRKQQDQQSNDFIDANNNENGEMALDDFGSDCNSSNISLQRTDSMAVISNSVKHKNSLKRHDSRHSGTFSMIAPAVTEPSPLYSKRNSISSIKSHKLNKTYITTVTNSNGDGNNNNTDMENSFDENIRSTLGLLAILQHQPNTAFGKKAKFFLLAIALCHTCVPEIDEETKDVFYQASSPDEFALVTAAKELGYVVIDRTMSSVSLRINHGDPNGLKSINDEPNNNNNNTSSTNTFETYEILNVVEFSSKRKRMSIIYRLPDGRICLLCKGADTIILESLKDPRNTTTTMPVSKGHNHAKIIEKTDIIDNEGNNINISDNNNDDNNIENIGLPSRSPSRNLKLDTNIYNINANIITMTPTSIHSMNNFATSSVPVIPEDSPISINHHDHREGSYYFKTTDSDYSIMDSFPIQDETWLHSQTMYHIQDFATEGLRTLLYGHRFLEEEEYQLWNKLYQEASTSMKDRQQKMEDVAELIEKDLEITGATAIEDKLQSGVPETIDLLRKANIRIWMLTGDKRETAINIGYSCSLIKDYSTTIILDSHVNLQQLLKQAIKDIRNRKVLHPVAVVDGETLMKIEQDPELIENFVDLGILCDAVICCRVSPSQKALVVHSIRQKLKHHVTLAIGDGANDIAMIQEAHVGIGITGKEGLQAARSSDYSIAQFRFLKNLLLVHGRWSYIRSSKFVLGTFYKCMCFYFTQALFQYYVGFSGTSLYESWTLSFYNTLFSSLPVLVIGVFEKDLNQETLLGFPQLYTIGQRNGAFNLKLFFSWMCGAIYNAFVIVLIPFFLHGRDVRGTGSPQLYELGLIVYTCVVFVVTIKIAYLECHNWTIITHITSFITIFGWFLYQTVYSYIYPNNFHSTPYEVNGVFRKVSVRTEFWTTVFLIIFFAIVPIMVVKVFKSIILPTDVDIYQEIEKDKRLLEKLMNENESSDDNNNVGEMVNDNSQKKTKDI